jgi:hypothetical protein
MKTSCIITEGERWAYSQSPSWEKRRSGEKEKRRKGEEERRRRGDRETRRPGDRVKRSRRRIFIFVRWSIFRDLFCILIKYLLYSLRGKIRKFLFESGHVLQGISISGLLLDGSLPQI